MTAVIIASQPSHGLIHVVTDAAFYSRDQRVLSYGTKAHTIPHWPGVVTATGSAAAPPLLAGALSQCFGSFDAFASANAFAIRELIRACGLLNGGSVDMIVAGVSAERGPEAYTFRIGDDLPPGVTRAEAEASPLWTSHEGALVKLPTLVMTPVPDDVVIPARYDGVDLDADPSEVIWSLRKILEMQRQMKLPAEIGGIGGFGQLTSISSNEIVQQTLQMWFDDKIGGALKPSPINWDDWHRANPSPRKAKQQPARNYIGGAVA